MKLMTVDEAGRPNAFYDPEVHGDAIPPEAVEITNEQWQECLNSQGRRIWNGEAFIECAPPLALNEAPAVDQIHMAWFRAALAESGDLTAVDTAVAALGPVKQTLWEYSTSIRIDDPDVIAVAAGLDIDLRDTFDRAAVIRDERNSA